jgi:hypothetical protein
MTTGSVAMPKGTATRASNGSEKSTTSWAKP